jgi:hypothetical protein
LSNKDFTVVVNGQLHALVALPPGKGPQELFRAMRRERFLAFIRIQTLIGPAPAQSLYQTELFQLQIWSMIFEIKMGGMLNENAVL